MVSLDESGVCTFFVQETHAQHCARMVHRGNVHLWLAPRHDIFHGCYDISPITRKNDNVITSMSHPCINGMIIARYSLEQRELYVEILDG
jgi:hypothetical protein